MSEKPEADQFTDRELTLIRYWKALFGTTPGDWKLSEIEPGTSSFILWREWLAQERTSLDLIRECLEAYAEAKDPPTFYAIRKAYRAKTSGFRHTQPGHRCDACGDSGIITVRCLRYRGQTHVDTGQDVPPDATRFDNSVPCRCSSGQRHNTNSLHYQYPQRIHDRLFKLRVVPGSRPPPDVDTETREWIDRLRASVAPGGPVAKELYRREHVAAAETPNQPPTADGDPLENWRARRAVQAVEI